MFLPYPHGPHGCLAFREVYQLSVGDGGYADIMGSYVTLPPVIDIGAETMEL